MNGALLTSKTGMQAQELQLQFISNNLANASTASYKASRPEFAALMTMKAREPSGSEGSATGGLQIGTGVRAVGSIVDFRQGQAIKTDRPLDLMIQGDGFLKITNENGDEFYTRNGSLIINGDGKIATVNNYILEPEVVVPDNATSIEFNKDGLIIAKTPDSTEGVEIGQIELFKFFNNNGLEPMDGGIYSITDSSGDELSGEPNKDGFGYILQGYTEGSNVDSINEMVNMISAQRSYEMASKAMSAANESMQTLNNVL